MIFIKGYVKIIEGIKDHSKEASLDSHGIPRGSSKAHGPGDSESFEKVEVTQFDRSENLIKQKPVYSPGSPSRPNFAHW